MVLVIDNHQFLLFRQAPAFHQKMIDEQQGDPQGAQQEYGQEEIDQAPDQQQPGTQSGNISRQSRQRDERDNDLKQGHQHDPAHLDKGRMADDSLIRFEQIAADNASGKSGTYDQAKSLRYIIQYKNTVQNQPGYQRRNRGKE